MSEELNKAQSNTPLSTRSIERSFGTPLSIKSVERSLARILASGNSQSGLRNRDILYVTSSDPLAILELLDVAGKNVATIGGSGEFAQIFINQGARSVQSIDTSIASCCYTELRAAALQILPFEEYEAAFGEWKHEGSDIRWSSLISASAWSRLRCAVSEPTRMFFDTLAAAEGTHRHGMSFLRSRRSNYSSVTGYESYIGSPAFGVDNEAKYMALRSRARNCRMEIVNSDFVEAITASIENPDVAYLSNIGYHVRSTIQCARQLQEEGVPRIVFSMKDISGALKIHGGKVYELSDDMRALEEREPDDWRGVKFLTQDPCDDSPQLQGFENDYLIVPGEVIDFDGLRIRYIGSDVRAKVPIICEVVDADTPHPASTLDSARANLRGQIGANFLMKK